MSVNVFGRTSDGVIVNAYTIRNSSGMTTKIIFTAVLTERIKSVDGSSSG